MDKTTTIVIIAVVIAAGWWLMNGAASPAVTENNTAPTATGAVADTQPQTITVSGSEFKYEPNTISAKVGQPITVVYKNVGQYPHDFVIDELGVQSPVIKSGETGSFSFTPTKAGSFSFYCSLPNHLERGMKGTIVVE